MPSPREASPHHRVVRLRCAIALPLALAGCAGGDWPADAAGVAETGYASWYGEEAAGGRTASGERFDPARITAAHRTLPLGSLAEVTDLATGRSILVRINDRGPGRRDRLIDLSSGAAHLLGTDAHALGSVRVRPVVDGREGRVVSPGRLAAVPLATPPTSPSGRYLVQIASFSSEARARDLADRLDADVVPAGALWRVRMGPFDVRRAEAARDAAAARGYADAHLLATD